MYTERLLLEVEASRLGWNVVKPPVVTGRSGVVHSFSFLATSGKMRYGFDVYDEVTEIQVINSFIKGFDTDVSVQIISSEGRATQSAKKLATEYRIKVLSEAELRTFFEEMLLKKGAEPGHSLRLHA